MSDYVDFGQNTWAMPDLEANVAPCDMGFYSSHLAMPSLGTTEVYNFSADNPFMSGANAHEPYALGLDDLAGPSLDANEVPLDFSFLDVPDFISQPFDFGQLDAAGPSELLEEG